MGTNSSAPFPKQQCGPRKLVHLVRHAQGMHNLESDKSRDPLTSCEFFDAQLSSQGWQQVRHQRKDVCASGLLQGIQLVITSPMSSTLQTAVGIFHGEDQQDRLDVTSFPDETDQTQAFNHPPIIAFELCRERLAFINIDQWYRGIKIENEEDILWKANEREPQEDVLARGIKFINWLALKLSSFWDQTKPCTWMIRNVAGCGRGKRRR
ncbi:hypothetical protein V6N13_056996 [Hibiscus sabdariffa]